MERKMKKMVVSGDVTVDWFFWSVKGMDPGGMGGEIPLNWELHTGMRKEVIPGGAMLLARFVKDVTGSIVISPQLTNLNQIPPEEVLHFTVMLSRFPYSSVRKAEKDMVLRVEKEAGYTGPTLGKVKQLTVADDDPDAEIVVIDDAGNGFRDEEPVWPAALKDKRQEPFVVLKMCGPLARGKLWDWVQKSHAERLVVVISADDLRTEGVQISRQLSWERTAADFIWQITNNRSLETLAACHNLVVFFGLDGVIHYMKDKDSFKVHLYYDPLQIEGGFSQMHRGGMIGLTSAFVATMVAELANGGLDGLGEGIRRGIVTSRRLLQKGFGNDSARVDYPGKELFLPPQKDEPQIMDVPVPRQNALDSEEIRVWTILEDLTQQRLEDVAYNTLTAGKDPALDKVPIGQFGKLKTLDRTEIESFRSIKNLMVEYLSKGFQNRPLSIAIFGPPGSGKSFGATQVAKSIGEESIERLEFNISQWESPDDLIKALHQVRDTVLRGSVPLVFFDEFDSNFQGLPLGWLKYFLEPMQSGVFKHGDITHPIGKSIFIFAGGTSEAFKNFSREGCDEKEINLFKEAKGPDFLSRLRGYVDILGLNKIGENDKLYMIRRAILLRSLLDQKARHFFDSTGILQIDPGVRRAMIKVPEYRHGVRSMEAILDMSMLTDKRVFEQSALPPPKQLKLHVDAELFSKLVTMDVLFGEKREDLARIIHNSFLQDIKKSKEKRPKNDPAIKPWDKLNEHYKESNRQQADNIPRYLHAAGYGFSPVVRREPVRVKLSIDEIGKMARMEHERWVVEKMGTGWKYGEKKDTAKKLHPCLCDWGKLPKKEQDKDRHTVRRFLDYLAQAGFEICKLD
ncbi:MAG: hypothetical protein AMJ94_00185 [Deltaproteobacteria bacterium SM23_61]|nr:MAG: hypothetical protein AMJ94_00185 [Deltaproteobacteria bacterium SM23_61]